LHIRALDGVACRIWKRRSGQRALDEEIPLNVLRLFGSYVNPCQPSFLVLFVTARCNARCGFCFYGDQLNRPPQERSELSLEEFRRISEHCGNIPYLLISGGEPVLRDDLFEIVSHFIRNAGAQFVTIPSNGLSPERSEELFTRLTASFPGCHFRAAFSIDYPDDRHDRSRGVPHSFESVMDSASRINRLKKTVSNLTLDIVTVYLADNAGDHSKLRSVVQERIAPDNHELHLLRPEWPSVTVPGICTEDFLKELALYRSGSVKRESRYLSPMFRGLNSLYIHNMKSIMSGRRHSGCTAGRKITVIDENGKVRLCEFRTDILGDLRTSGYDLKRILRQKSSREALREMHRARCTCTWECAVSTDIITNPRFYPALMKATLRQMGKIRRQTR
jgi:Fe-coproporphyrin III synthase